MIGPDAPVAALDPGAARRVARRRRRSVAVGVAGAALLLVAAGCSDDDGGVQAGGPTSAATSDTTVPTTAPSATSTTEHEGSTSTSGEGIDPLDDADLEAKSGPATASGTALIERVEVGRHEGYDRVVFQFAGDGLPGWEVAWVDGPVRQDGSGEAVEVPGAAVLGVRLDPASIVDLSGVELEQVYDGPDRVEGTGGTVVEVVRASDFEAVSRWAIGLADRVDFRVLTLSDPPRLVVDVRNH